MKKDEVRCLRLKRDQLLELLWACYRGMGYKGLKLPRWGLRFGTVCTGWDYNGETGQMTFFTYRAGADEHKIKEFLRSCPSETTESLYMGDLKMCRVSLAGQKRLPRWTGWFPKGEVRFLRLGFPGMREVLTEFFMGQEQTLFGVDPEREEDTVLTFSLPEDLEEMTVWLSRTDLVLEGKYQELFERCKANQEPGNAAALLARRNNKK